MDPDLLTDYDALLRRALADACERAATAEPPDADAKWLPGGWHAAYGPIVPLAMAHFDPLSPRELEVLRLLAGARSQSEIARALTVSVNTVRSHVKHIYDKLDVHSRHEAVERARELGLL